MRIYKCDSCNKLISDPYTVGMKEFYLGVDTDCLGLIGIAIPFECKRKIKTHLCDDCTKACMLLPKKRSVKTMIEKELKIRDICDYCKNCGNPCNEDEDCLENEEIIKKWLESEVDTN